MNLADKYLLWVDCDCTNCSSICAEGYRENNERIRLWSRVPEMNRLQSMDCAVRTITHSPPTPSYIHTYIHTYTPMHTHATAYDYWTWSIWTIHSLYLWPHKLTPFKHNSSSLSVSSPHIYSSTFIFLYFLNASNFILISFFFFSSFTSIPFLLWFIPRHTYKKRPLLGPLSTTGSLAGPVFPTLTTLL